MPKYFSDYQTALIDAFCHEQDQEAPASLS